MCGSGQQAANFAAANVMAGQHDVLIAGGVEHMTRVPMGSDGDSLTDTYFEHFDELTTQGEGAERIAEEYDLTREGLDEIAADSQRRWKEAWDEGRYDDQITPVETELDGEESESQSDSDSRTGSETTRERRSSSNRTNTRVPAPTSRPSELNCRCRSARRARASTIRATPPGSSTAPVRC